MAVAGTFSRRVHARSESRRLTQRDLQAEKQNIALGGPKFYSPGTCPADFKFLHYGVHILGKNP